MGYKWDINGISMGCKWDINGISMGYIRLLLVVNGDGHITQCFGIPSLIILNVDLWVILKQLVGTVQISINVENSHGTMSNIKIKPWSKGDLTLMNDHLPSLSSLTIIEPSFSFTITNQQ